MVAIVSCSDPSGLLGDVYRDAFCGPPYEEGEREVAVFGHRLEAHRRRPRFTCMLAREATQIVGFAYGFVWWRSAPPSPWYATLAAELGTAVAERHLRGAFEVRELAVRSAWQGRGIGTALLEGLVARSGIDRSWLVVHGAAHDARAFYAARGWRAVGRLGSDEQVLVRGPPP